MYLLLVQFDLDGTKVTLQLGLVKSGYRSEKWFLCLVFICVLYYSQAEAMETQEHTVISTAPVSADRPDDIKTATAHIKQQSAIKHIILSG